jgi:hypothetical protein
MTSASLLQSLITAVPGRHRYLDGTGHALRTAIVSAGFSRQNLKHPIPNHQADRAQNGQNQHLAGHSTVVLSGTDKLDHAAAANSP